LLDSIRDDDTEMMKKVDMPCQDFTLEGIFSLPEGGGPYGLVVVCHPHPLYGGNMYNNVVHGVCEKLGKKKLAWLKFNFREVGESGGKFGGGIGEREDVKAAISFGESHPKINPELTGLCGYSFGSSVAFSVAGEDPRVKAVAGISPFVQPETLLDHYTRPKLFTCGSRDGFVDVKALEQLVRRLPEPKELAVYPGADHFWAGEEEPMAEKVSRFFAHNLK
jgi:alpha/beta superfamily hydrolase